MIVLSTSTSQAASGSIEPETEASSGGAGGDVKLTVGTGGVGTGGSVVLTAGEAAAASTAGGDVRVTGGTGSSSASSGGVRSKSQVVSQRAKLKVKTRAKGRYRQHCTVGRWQLCGR